MAEGTEAKGNWISSSFSKVLSWARSRSLWYISTGPGCCANELFQTVGCRYDLERFGSIPQEDPTQADLLIINGSVSIKAAQEIKKIYDSMLDPKYVMAIGTCACSGGLFSPEWSYSTVEGAGKIVPVDIYIPGCPPRPEAIMDGIIKLQEKIGGVVTNQRAH